MTTSVQPTSPTILLLSIERFRGIKSLTWRPGPGDTICRLETGWATLTAAAQSAQSAVVERDARTTSLVPGARRSRVRFVGDLSDDEVRDLLSGAGTAKVVDERPAGQRRANLTGRLCDLGH